jgi:hypothetical protein
MRYALLPAVATILLLPSALAAQSQPASNDAPGDAEFMRAAEAGGPANIAKNATIVRMEPGGKVTRMREGANGFTCSIMPDGSNTPFCGDQQAMEWMVAAMSKQPQPTNTQPGVAYMAKGGVHHETKDGAIVMEPAAGTKEVKEPAHWMLLWPLDSARTGLPTRPNDGGSYIMFAGTPYAHLMVYQDPKKLKQ